MLFSVTLTTKQYIEELALYIAVLYCITQKSLDMTIGLTLSTPVYMHFVCAIQNVEAGNGHSVADHPRIARYTQRLAISTNAHVGESQLYVEQ